MSEREKFKRRIYVIDREFQFQYILQWILVTLSLFGGMVLTTLSLFFFFRESLFRYFIPINAGVAVFATGLSLYCMVRLSHRVAGPAWRLEHTVRALADGTYNLHDHVHLRRKDYLQRLAGALNTLIDRRALERDELSSLVAGFCELDSNVQASPFVSTESKQLCRRLFSSVVELARASNLPEMYTSDSSAASPVPETELNELPEPAPNACD